MITFIFYRTYFYSYIDTYDSIIGSLFLADSCILDKYIYRNYPPSMYDSTFLSFSTKYT